MKGFFQLLLTIGLLLGNSLGHAEEVDSALTCSEFQKIFFYFQDQHLRFFLSPETNRVELIEKAKKAVPNVLRDLGYSMLAAQFESTLLPKLPPQLTQSEAEISSLCDSLKTSLYQSAFLKAYAKGLDPYSDFYLSEELDTRSSVLDGEFVGVGIASDSIGDHLEINHVVEDGPAAGKLFVGDKIFKIDGHSVKGLSELEIRQRIRGQKGTKVVFYIERDKQMLDVAIIRDKVNQRSVTAEMVDNRFLMLKVLRFYRQTPLEVETALQSYGSKVKGLILDLRNNPGGLLQAARDLVDLFISSGVVVYLRGRDMEEQVWAMNEGGYLTLPIVVLVNEGTASAAEIVAGALQDYGRAMVVGQRTYGKGSVQNIYETQSALGTKYRGGFKLTTLLYYLPSGRNVKRLEPDVVASVAGEHVAIDHPEMPFHGPDQILVSKISPFRGFERQKTSLEKLKQGMLDLSTHTSEELGRTLLNRMTADSRTNVQ